MATPTIAGTGETTFTSTASPTITYVSAGVGNALVVVVTTTAARTINSITDDMTTPTTYSQVVTQASTSQVYIWLGNNITDADSTIITVNLSSAGTGSISVIEIAGLSDATPNDVSSSAINSTANPALTAAAGAIDTTTDVCVVMVFRPTATTTFTTPGTYTRLGTGNAFICCYNTFAAAQTDEGSTSNTISLAASRSGPGAIASFKADAAAGGVPGRIVGGGVAGRVFGMGG